MIRLTFLLAVLFLSIIIPKITVRARSDDPLIDGPCKTPEGALPLLTDEEFAGLWYGTSTNSLNSDTKITKCVEVTITAVNQTWITDTIYDEGEEHDLYLVEKLKRVPNQPRLLAGYQLDDKEKWNFDGFNYAIFGRRGNTFLAYCCQVVGSQHREFFEIYGRTNSASTEEVNNLKEIVRKTGDQKIFYDTNTSDKCK